MNLINGRHKNSIPLRPVENKSLRKWLTTQPSRTIQWVSSTGFNAKNSEFCLIPGEDGNLHEVLVGGSDNLWDWASLPDNLPDHIYHLIGDWNCAQSNKIALGWALGGYRYDRFKQVRKTKNPLLIWPQTCDRASVQSAVTATFLVRDLINTPASHMGPAELADAANQLAQTHSASMHTLVGNALLDKHFPAIYAVGRAASDDRHPRLIDITWGNPSHPKVSLVGKGVCFDTGGLNLKDSNGMYTMKKDMGGGAHALGLASMIMEQELPVRLRVLIPAVENSVSSLSYRPLDIVPTRKGINIEIGNTDAEGRVILADALTEASSEHPALLIDFATLTGAARVALGGELPAMFSNDDDIAKELLKHATNSYDPLWQMPLWQPYRKFIEGKVGHITNSADSPLGGAITAALFLQEFVESTVPWIHIDLMAWNTATRGGRTEGGEAMGIRAIYSLLESRFKQSTS